MTCRYGRTRDSEARCLYDGPHKTRQGKRARWGANMGQLPDSDRIPGAIRGEPARAQLCGLPILRATGVALGVSVLVLILISSQLYRVAWSDAWREVHEKHRVLAANLAAPIAAYVEDRRRLLSAMADDLRARGIDPVRLPELAREDFGRFARRLAGVSAVSLLRADGVLMFSTAAKPRDARTLRESMAYHYALARRSHYVTGVETGIIDHQPVVRIGQPLRGHGGDVVAVLIADLDPAPIDRLRSQVHFGAGGHAAVVDQHGRVVAHPNPEWMQDRRDLSHVSVVQAMMAGGSGVTEFYSPFVQGDMVAGYTTIPALGWGVMVPQPKEEIARRVNRLLQQQILLALGVLGLLGVLAYGAARWVTRN